MIGPGWCLAMSAMLRIYLIHTTRRWDLTVRAVPHPHDSDRMLIDVDAEDMTGVLAATVDWLDERDHRPVLHESGAIAAFGVPVVLSAGYGAGGGS